MFSNFLHCQWSLVFMLKNIVRAVQRVMISFNEPSSADGLSRVISGRVEKPTLNGINLSKNLNAEQVDQLTKDGLVETKKKVKLVKYAILLAYQGKNYFGMQIQQNIIYPTIESNLLGALHKYGIISKEESKNPNMFYFQRAARTDRAVSAVQQVCSMQLPLNEEFASTGAEKLNELLPEDIRVLDIRRTTRTFHAQKSCDFRTYSYTLPTYAFAPLSELTTAKYRITEEQLAKVNDILSAFVGTHNFYNYTARRDYDDQSCKRYMISLKCDIPFIYRNELHGEDMEFVSIYVKGQSFMMHQIRKMIGVTISVIRGFMYQSDIQKSFEQNRMDIPKAPGNGLLLEQLHYQLYDKKFSKTHAKLDDWGPEVESRIQQARKKLILSEMLRNECVTQCMMQWLSTLAVHRVICDPEDETGTSASDMRFANALVSQKKKSNADEAEEDACDEQLQKTAAVVG